MTRSLLGRKQINHAEVAAKLRSQPGEWGSVGSYWNKNSARVIARQVETGERLPAYRPAGAFEAAWRRDQDNGWAVYARYIDTEGAA